MALRYDYSRVHNWQTVCEMRAEADDPVHGVSKGDTIIRPETEALIFASLVVGLSEISGANWRTFYGRLHAWERLERVRTLHADGSAKHTAPETVYAHIGLSTNVSRETDAQWRKRIVGGIVKDYERNAAEAVERANDTMAEVTRGL